MTRAELDNAAEKLKQVEQSIEALVALRDKISVDIAEKQKQVRSYKRKLGKARSLLNFIEKHETKNGATV